MELLLTNELIHALPPSERRVYSRSEAASYVGVSPGFFDKLVRRGAMPPPLQMLGVRRWDRAALDRALDMMSGLVHHAETDNASSAYDSWRRARGEG